MIPWPKLMDILGPLVSREEAQAIWTAFKRIEERSPNGRIKLLVVLDKIGAAIINQTPSKE